MTSPGFATIVGEVVTMTRSVLHAPNRADEVFELWCTLTGYDPAMFDEPDLASFRERPEIPDLAATPDAVLRDAGEAVRRDRSLPLERWLAAVRIVRPGRHVGSSSSA
jgi:hypothetical protein